MLKRLLLLQALFCATLACSSQAATVDDVIHSGVLRVCTPGDYKPFSYTHSPGTYEGLDVDLVRSLADSLGAKVQFVATSWPKLMDDFTASKCDIAAGGISVSLDRQRKAWFSAPYMVNGKVPLVRCADVKHYQTLADIDKPGVRVITNPGGSNERYARAHFTHATLTIHPENLTIFEELLAGRADVFVTESAEARVQQHLRPGLCAVNPDKPLQYSENALLLPRGDVVTKAYVDQWLHLLKASGELQNISQRWIN
ncbi:transporter substrate-binding domain-containing protein [Crenobacter sp. SG2303]|uniref:Transporter substrate-binding domain-containing protein n=1 Tax=Crenobacter oryzisoli TaxID=3056844 RepID=A0ABT7XIR7_9NEIS|nr:transporter substrate-binding domain-containing protein [Crenobacter sp. SG2303]MDN0073663.1 transporter substrate-binding domain-containing protein [Crenobacter sp. SG2303]